MRKTKLIAYSLLALLSAWLLVIDIIDMTVAKDAGNYAKATYWLLIVMLNAVLVSIFASLIHSEWKKPCK